MLCNMIETSSNLIMEVYTQTSRKVMAPMEVHHLKRANLVPDMEEANSHVRLLESFILEEIIPTTFTLPPVQTGKTNTK
jgi:hypothetical protein